MAAHPAGINHIRRPWLPDVSLRLHQRRDVRYDRDDLSLQRQELQELDLHRSFRTPSLLLEQLALLLQYDRGTKIHRGHKQLL